MPPAKVWRHGSKRHHVVGLPLYRKRTFKDNGVLFCWAQCCFSWSEGSKRALLYPSAAAFCHPWNHWRICKCVNIVAMTWSNHAINHIISFTMPWCPHFLVKGLVSTSRCSFRPRHCHGHVEALCHFLIHGCIFRVHLLVTKFWLDVLVSDKVKIVVRVQIRSQAITGG